MNKKEIYRIKNINIFLVKHKNKRNNPIFLYIHNKPYISSS